MTFLNDIHPERKVAGFTRLDGTLGFYNFVRARMLATGAKRVLDFGAGRGAFVEDPCLWRREIHDLRQTGAEVWAADISSVVRQHPCSHHQVQLEPGQPLPFADQFFDLIVSDFTFEHLEQPAGVASELLRILAPGGTICARTPNKWGYPAIAARLVPNRLHVRTLRDAQPDRKACDVFPTCFRLNTVGAVRRHFPDCEVAWYCDSAEPAYHFGNRLAYRIMLAIHNLLPRRLSTTFCFFITKPGHAARAAD